MHHLLVSGLQLNLNWLWLGLIIAALVFLIVTVILLLTAAGSAAKRVKQIGEEAKPSLEQLDTSLASIQIHLDNTAKNIEEAKAQVEAEVEAVNADIGQITETVGIVGSTTGASIGEITSLVAATAGMISEGKDTVRRFRTILPEKARKSGKGAKLARTSDQEKRKGLSAMKKTKKNIIVTVPGNLRDKLWLALRPAATGVRKGRNKIRKQKTFLGKQVKSGKRRILSFRKKGRKLLKKGKRSYRNVRRNLA